LHPACLYNQAVNPFMEVEKVKHLSKGLAALGLLLLLGGPAFAGTAYSFTTETRDGFRDAVIKGRLLVDGEKFRLEREPNDDPEIPQVEISKDGGKQRFALDPAARTFFELEKPEAKVTSPLFLLIPASGDRTVSNVKVETREGAEPETVSGSTVRRHEIMLSYDLTILIAHPVLPPGVPRITSPREKVSGSVKAEAVYWMAEDKAPLPAGSFAPEIRTGIPEVDGKLAGALAALRGLAVKQQVTVSTAGDSYVAAQTSVVTATIEGPKPFKTEAALFEVPSGFRMHKPEVIRPGLLTPPTMDPN
jgi:hypothetical protein